MPDISRRDFLTWTAGLVSTLSFPAVAQGQRPIASAVETPALKVLPPVKLRGYGTLSVAFRTMPSSSGVASLTHITCESHEKALLVQAKYLSDLAQLPGTTSDKPTIRRAPAGGAVACYAEGSDVLILAAPSEPDLARQIALHTPPGAPESAFTARAAIPMYLNRFDQHGLLIYYGAWVTPPHTPAYDYSQDFKFVKDNKTGLIVWENTLQDDTGEGMTNSTWWDWIQADCMKNGIPLHVNLMLAWPMLWLGNRYREETMLKAPQFVGGYYGVAHDSCGVGAVSWHSKTAEAAALGISQETVRRFVKDPNIVGWLEPHGETSEMPQALLLESGPLPDQSMQEYLRENYGTLEAVSDRWWADKAHYKSWDEIKAPELAEFVGFGAGAIDLQTTWRVKYLPAPDGHMYTRGEAQSLGGVVVPTAPMPPEWTQPGFDDSAWDQLLAPGNDRATSMVWSPMVYRRTVTVPETWLAANPKSWLYLWVVFGRSFDEHLVYVNGQRMPRDANLSLAYEITSALKAGENTIVLIPARGIICYRAYFSHEPPAQYPNLGKAKNARWVDFREWTANARAVQIGRGLEMIRQVDPDRPINIMSPDENAGVIKQAAEKYGGMFHNTGYASGFWAEYHPLLMRGSGLPATAEPGNGAPNAHDFRAAWGRWLTEGLNAIHYFQHLGEITWRPDILQEFETNRAMYEMIGKYHVPEAEVAVLLSTRNDQLSGWPWRQDPDQFQPGGYWRDSPSFGLVDYCPRDGVTEEDFGGPNVSKYRIIIDSNTSIMSGGVINDIEKWVRGGGVFVTYGQTGRHSETEPDTWPIANLAGYDVTSITGWGKNSSLQLAPGQSVYKSITWTDKLRSYGLQLKPNSPDCEPLLLWSDGTPASGMRPLGKGWIVTVGYGIRGQDVEQFLSPILQHFGARKRVPCRAVTTASNIHFRHYIGNTGLHDIWVLFNESEQPASADLVFVDGYHAPSMVDVVSGQAAPITRDPSGGRIPNVALAPMQTRMWISAREAVAASPLEWITLQRGWWRGTVAPDPAPLPSPAENQKFSVDLTAGWRFKAADDLTDDQSAALTLPSVSDTAWERRNLNIWTPDHPTVKHGVLRRSFTVPAHWTNGVIGLCVSHVQGVFANAGQIFVDGQPLLPRYLVGGVYLDPAKGLLKPGETHLLALDVKSQIAEAGVRGHAWLYYLPDPQDRLDLAGSWQCYTDPVHLAGDVTLPGSFQGQFASRKVVIDQKYTDKNVLIYVDAGSVQGIMVNGKLTTRSSQQVYNPIFSINVTPYVRFGEENFIDLAVNPDPRPNPIAAVEIRYYDKGVYP